MSYVWATLAIFLLRIRISTNFGMAFRLPEVARNPSQQASLPADPTNLHISGYCYPGIAFGDQDSNSSESMCKAFHSLTLLSAEMHFYMSRKHCCLRDGKLRFPIRHCCRPMPFPTPRSTSPPTGKAVSPDDRHCCRPSGFIRWERPILGADEPLRGTGPGADLAACTEFRRHSLGNHTKPSSTA
jgi:hypothetical protein